MIYQCFMVQYIYFHYTAASEMACNIQQLSLHVINVCAGGFGCSNLFIILGGLVGHLSCDLEPRGPQLNNCVKGALAAVG